MTDNRNIKTPPVDSNLIHFAFPQVKQHTLRNGLQLLIIERHDLPKVYLRIGMNCGAKSEPPEKCGLTEILAATLKKGTETRNYSQIIDQIDFVGGDLDAVANEDFFFVFGEFLKEYLDLGLELMADLILNPTFPSAELQKERQRMIANLENEKSSPHFLAARRMDKALYFPHPYYRHKTEQTLQQLERDDLVRFHSDYFVPKDSFLVMAGDITEPDAIDRAEKYLGAWQDHPMPRIPFESPLPAHGRKIYLVDRPGSAQSNLLLGNLLFSRNHPDFIKMMVMNKILGGSATGRLFMHLREEKGFTYSAFSMMQTQKETGSWQANAEVRTEVTAPALEAFFEQFNKIKTEEVSEDDLANTKRFLIGIFPLQNESPSSIAALSMRQKLYELPANYWNEYLENIGKVSRRDILQIARQYIQEDVMSLVVVGDAEKIESKLRPFGDLEVYNLEDERIR